MRAALDAARRGLRARRRRALITALGIVLAAAMLSAAAVVADGLGLGFTRAVRAAGLGDLIVRFDPQPRSLIAQRVSALPDISGYASRLELTDISVQAGHRRRGDAVAEVVNPAGRRGYAIVAGRNLSPLAPEVLLEQAFAQAWGIRLGQVFDVGGLGPLRVVGLVQAPDNVGFPLAKPRVYVSQTWLANRLRLRSPPPVNLVEIWLRNPAFLNEVLVQARDTSFGLRNVRFATRAGVRVLLHQAAGIVIDLLVALSLISLVTAGVMLGGAARAEVQRRLGAIGIERAVGASPGHIVLAQSLEAAVVSVPAALVGCAAGTLAIYGPAARLLSLLNEPPPGRGLTLPLAGCCLVAALLPIVGVAWPAWRAAREPVVSLLRGGDLTAPTGAARPSGAWGRTPGFRGPAMLGARLVAARRVRLVATVTTLGLSAAFVLLMLSLSSALQSLQTDPGALGRRYSLTSTLPPSAAPRVRRIPGVQAAAPRYETEAADSFSLGETIAVIAYPGQHTIFEAPPLLAGRRLRGSDEAEIGEGIAQALGVGVGQTLALALADGHELRLRVAGVVSSLDQEGRVAYVPASALLRADPAVASTMAIVTAPDADLARVSSALSALGAVPQPTGGATARGGPLVALLRTILRAIAVVDGLVCLYALVQACGLTVLERRRTLAVLQAIGGGPATLRRLLLGAALMLVVPAAAIGVALERLVLGPILSGLAVGYASLSLAASPAEILLTAGGLLAAAVIAVGWVARQAGREPVVAGLAA